MPGSRRTLKVGYISLQNSSESPQLDAFRADDCFQLRGETETVTFFPQ